jgi:general secretion pathway protein H
MPISAIGIWINNFRQRGFTLLEVMVTMVLIGIIASFAVLSLRGSSETERLAEEARRLAALLELNHQEAILRGEQRGVHFTEQGYAFVSLVGKEWLPAADSSLLREHQLPAEFTLTLWVQNRRVQFEDHSTATPQVLLLSSGEATDFRVVFSIGERADPHYSVSGDITGKLSYGPT